MKCERCDGEGKVITYERRPLFCGPTRGLEVLRAIRRGEHDRELARFPFAHLRLLFAAKARPEAFQPTACPDCAGTGTQPDPAIYRIVQVDGEADTGGVT